MKKTSTYLVLTSFVILNFLSACKSDSNPSPLPPSPPPPGLPPVLPTNPDIPEVGYNEDGGSIFKVLAVARKGVTDIDVNLTGEYQINVNYEFFVRQKGNYKTAEEIGINHSICPSHIMREKYYSLILIRTDSPLGKHPQTTLSMFVRNGGVDIYDNAFNADFSKMKAINKRSINGKCVYGVLTLEKDQGTIIQNGDVLAYRDQEDNLYFGVYDSIHAEALKYNNIFYSVTDISMESSSGNGQKAVFYSLYASSSLKNFHKVSTEEDYQVYRGKIDISTKGNIPKFVENIGTDVGNHFFSTNLTAKERYIGVYKDFNYLKNNILAMAEPAFCNPLPEIPGYKICKETATYFLATKNDEAKWGY